jgi:hypothetical protein
MDTNKCDVQDARQCNLKEKYVALEKYCAVLERALADGRKVLGAKGRSACKARAEWKKLVEQSDAEYTHIPYDPLDVFD